MTDAETLFNDAFFRTTDGWGVVQSLRVVVEAGMPLARDALACENLRFIEQQLRRPDSEALFVKEKVTPSAADALARMIVDTTVSQAMASVDGASLIYMHSILDGVALDYCRVTALLAPELWADVVDDRKVSLRETKGATYDELLQIALTQYFERLERESVLRKIDMLYRACNPTRGTPSAVGGYIFDRERLERIDRLRHEIIHGAAIGRPIANAFDDLEYLVGTAMHLMAMVSDRFGPKINPSYAPVYYARKTAAPPMS